MSPFDIVVIFIVAAAVVAVVSTVIYRKVKHKGSSCGCDCGSCSMCSKCASDTEKHKDK